jgi:hypothetical protein
MTNRISVHSSSTSKTLTAGQVRACLYGFLVVLYVIVKLGHLTALAPTLSALSLAAILVSLPASGPVAGTLSLLLLGAGSWMLWKKDVGWSAYLSAYGEMLYLLALFTVVPMLAEPIKLGGYSQAIQAVLRNRISGVFKLNCMVTMLAFVCGSFMSLASIPIMMVAMEAVIDRYPVDNKMRFMVVSAISGYVLPMMWTPVSGVVGVVLYNLHMDWLSMFPTLFALSIACLFTNWIVFYLLEVRNKSGAPVVAAEAVADAEPVSPLPRLAQMLLGIILLVVTIALLEQWLQIGSITIVTLVSIPFAMAWSAVIGKAPQFVQGASAQLKSRLPRMADQFAIFLSGGFFVKAMHLSGFDHAANLMFLHLHDLIGTQLLLIVMPVMALIGSYAGVHPLVAIVLLGESLKPEVLGIRPSQMAVALVGSSVLTFMQGPFSGTLGLVQSITRISTFRLALWSAPYAAGYFVVLSIAILIV